MSRRTERPDQNWIIWNRETKSIRDFGTETNMIEHARTLNDLYQTDAYTAREFREDDR